MDIEPVTPHIIEQLQQIVGRPHLAISPEEVACYAYDGTGREYPPAAVVFPGSTEEIQAIMRLASATPFPVVPRGAGTGMTGGALAVAGGLVVAMNRMNRIVEIDRENQIAVVEPGVITGEFRRAVEKIGLFYPPDPASLNFCTMGGNVAECAGGPSAVKYGVTRDYVLGLEAVLPDGNRIHTGVRTAKGVMGYDLTRLLVGSEGTLAILTRIIVRLLPVPKERATLLVLSPGMEEAAALVTNVLAEYLPCTLEYMDRTDIQIIRHRLPTRLPEGTEALLLIELDGDRDSVARESEKLTTFLATQPGVIAVRQAANRNEADQLWAARRTVSPSAFDLRPHKISEDVVVPRTRIPSLVAHTEALANEHAIPIFTFGHAGDGNIHVNIMLDKDNPAEVSAAAAARQSLFEEVLRLGGTLSGEHGVGITKADILAREIDPDTLILMQRIKSVFDPQNILNPGKIFSPSAP